MGCIDHQNRRKKCQILFTSDVMTYRTIKVHSYECGCKLIEFPGLEFDLLNDKSNLFA